MWHPCNACRGKRLVRGYAYAKVKANQTVADVPYRAMELRPNLEDGLASVSLNLVLTGGAFFVLHMLTTGSWPVPWSWYPEPACSGRLQWRRHCARDTFFLFGRTGGGEEVGALQ